MTDSKPRYIGVVDVAKLVKGSLKKPFPVSHFPLDLIVTREARPST